MAFSGSSYFAGIGTAFAAIAVGFAGGAMVTTSAVQPPNRLERVSAAPIAPSKADAAPAAVASSSAEQAGQAKPPQQETPPPSAVAAAPTADSKPNPQPLAAAPAAVKTDAATNVQEQSAPTAARSADANKDWSRKRADGRKSSDDRKVSDRRRRPDQGERRLDEAANTVRQMPRGYPADEIVQRDVSPRFNGRPRRIEMFGDDDAPRVVNERPPRLGFFGDD
jgi:hypothetical protein